MGPAPRLGTIKGACVLRPRQSSTHDQIEKSFQRPKARALPFHEFENGIFSMSPTFTAVLFVVLGFASLRPLMEDLGGGSTTNRGMTIDAGDGEAHDRKQISRQVRRRD
jgi:hypothetical protein